MKNTSIVRCKPHQYHHDSYIRSQRTFAKTQFHLNKHSLLSFLARSILHRTAGVCVSSFVKRFISSTKEYLAVVRLSATGRGSSGPLPSKAHVFNFLPRCVFGSVCLWNRKGLLTVQSLHADKSKCTRGESDNAVRFDPVIYGLRLCSVPANDVSVTPVSLPATVFLPP